MALTALDETGAMLKEGVAAAQQYARLLSERQGFLESVSRLLCSLLAWRMCNEGRRTELFARTLRLTRPLLRRRRSSGPSETTVSPRSA